ncbi:chaperonin 10-like protein [Podospora appendiculata]|uniref:Chaperonin 10-like protein n=1 Tax=Podospora appendiculata TaxID=314037 RepID=A0AAE0X055_9PEZI|nr:chaperonin 10-like protein [Podospora appendiculata]
MPSAHPSRKMVRQYVATKKGGAFQVTSVPYPTPGPNELCIRNRAVALNHLDWKSLETGMMVKSWPAILGIDAAGVVEAVGDKVTAFKPGDAVMTIAGHSGPAGGFQEVTVVPSHFACRKPAAWTFVEAASVPICYITATAAIIKGLGTPLAHLEESVKPGPGPGPETPLRSEFNLDGTVFTGSNANREENSTGKIQKPPNIESVLVLGGSSGVGTSAIQLLRMALPDAKILSTNSPLHAGRLARLGATSCFDRDDPKIVAAIKEATPGGRGVDAIIDTVAAAQQRSELFDALNPDGPKLYSHVLTGDEIKIPENVKSVDIYGRLAFEATGGGTDVMTKLVELVDAKTFKLPLRVEVVGKDLESIGPGLEKLKAGVSGTKLVVSL